MKARGSAPCRCTSRRRTAMATLNIAPASCSSSFCGAAALAPTAARLEPSRPGGERGARLTDVPSPRNAPPHRAPEAATRLVPARKRSAPCLLPDAPAKSRTQGSISSRSGAGGVAATRLRFGPVRVVYLHQTRGARDAWRSGGRGDESNIVAGLGSGQRRAEATGELDWPRRSRKRRLGLGRCSRDRRW